MRLFGSPAGSRLRLHTRGAFRKGPRHARKRQQEARPYTAEEMARFRALGAQAPKPKPSFVSRVLTFLKRRIV